MKYLNGNWLILLNTKRREPLTLINFQEPLNLTKEDFWSTLKQTTPPDEESNRTQETIKKFHIKNGRDLTMLYLQMYFLQLADVFKNSVEKSTFEYSINLCFVTFYLVIRGKLVRR